MRVLSVTADAATCLQKMSDEPDGSSYLWLGTFFLDPRGGWVGQSPWSWVDCLGQQQVRMPG